MTWKFHVLANTQRRLFSRILQILESQMVGIHSFSGESNQHETSVTFVISSEEDKAYRIEALLYRLEDIQTMSATSEVLTEAAGDDEDIVTPPGSRKPVQLPNDQHVSFTER